MISILYRSPEDIKNGNMVFTEITKIPLGSIVMINTNDGKCLEIDDDRTPDVDPHFEVSPGADQLMFIRPIAVDRIKIETKEITNWGC